MATHSSTLDWKIPCTEEPGRLQSRGHKESDTTERLHFFFHLTWEKLTSSIPLALKKKCSKECSHLHHRTIVQDQFRQKLRRGAGDNVIA